MAADFERTNPFLQGFFERAADGHRFAHRFHCGCQHVGGLGKFFKSPARNLDHAVIEGGFERGEGLTGDVVGNFIQRIADRQFGRDFCNREPGRLGGQCRAPRHPGVHLYHDHLPIHGVDGKLHIGAAGVDPDFPHDGDRGIAHDLVFPVAEGLGGCNGDAVAGVNSHGVHVFNRTDDDNVVVLVPHHLQLELLPTEYGLFEHNLMNQAGVQSGPRQGFEFLGVVGHPAAGTAKSVARAHDNGKTDHIADRLDLVHVHHDAAARDLESDAAHSCTEHVAVFGFFNGSERRADHFDAVPLQCAHSRHFHGGIESGLAAQSRQEGVRTLLLDDHGHRFGGNRFDVGPIGCFGISHDGSRIAVHQDDLESLFFQGLAGLGTGIVELAGLTDDDGAGTDDQDFFNVRALGHGAMASYSACGSLTVCPSNP